MRGVVVSLLLLILIVLVKCTKTDSGEVRVSEKPFENLSEYHFFKGQMANLEPNTGVIPYDLNSPLFSDYAHKARFVWMPEGSTAKYDTTHVLEFPLGAVLIKNFYYNHDDTDLSKGRRIIETRILINKEVEWQALSYVWNAEQTDAKFEIIGGIEQVEWINERGEQQSVQYIIPNKNQCKGCHAYDKKQLPIGPKVRNLNKDYAYQDGIKNQLTKWTEVGYLTGYNETDYHPSVAVWDDAAKYSLHDRAMAYLDINCMHCHNPKGAANTSGLTLRADSELGLELGVYKATVSAGAGTGGHTYSIVPGHPEESIMVYRMNSDNPGAMMPELGRRLVHKEGVALIEEWIKSMNPDDFTKPANQSLN